MTNYSCSGVPELVPWGSDISIDETGRTGSNVSKWGITFTEVFFSFVRCQIKTRRMISTICLLCGWFLPGIPTIPTYSYWFLLFEVERLYFYIAWSWHRPGTTLKYRPGQIVGGSGLVSWAAHRSVLAEPCNHFMDEVLQMMLHLDVCKVSEELIFLEPKVNNFKKGRSFGEWWILRFMGL